MRCHLAKIMPPDPSFVETVGPKTQIIAEADIAAMPFADLKDLFVDLAAHRERLGIFMQARLRQACRRYGE